MVNNFNTWKILNKNHYIGSGAHWEVYRAYLEERQCIDDLEFFQFIYKVNKHGSADEIESNIYKYEQIRKTGLPTLLFYFKEKYKGEEVIIG